MKLYVLSYLNDPCDEMSNADVVGVFKVLKDAQDAMEDEYQDSLVNVLELNDCETEEELEDVDEVNLCKLDMQHTIYNNGDYKEWTITEWEV